MLRPTEGSVDQWCRVRAAVRTTWENLVWARKDVNARKADRLPDEAGLKLLATPKMPPELPVTLFIRNAHGVGDWELFLSSGAAASAER